MMQQPEVRRQTEPPTPEEKKRHPYTPTKSNKVFYVVAVLGVLIMKMTTDMSAYDIGVVFGTMWQAKNLKKASYDSYTYNLHKRVAENEQSHAVLRVLKYHLTTSKLSVWDMNH